MKYIFLPLIIFLTLFSCSSENEVIHHQLTTSSNPDLGGIVSPPSGLFPRGQAQTLIATPYPEYVFKNWSGSLSGSNNPSSIILNKDESVIGNFEKRQYPLTISYDGMGTVKEEVISFGNKSQYPSGTTVRLTAQPLSGWEFAGWSGDINSTVNPLEIKILKEFNLKVKFQKAVVKSLKILNPINEIIISKTHDFQIEVEFESGIKIVNPDSIKLSSLEKKVTIQKNRIIGAQSGNTFLRYEYKNKRDSIRIFVNPVEEITNIDDYLATPASNSRILVPVIVINYYATQNGIDIDTKRQPSYGSLDPITIENLKTKTIDQLRLTKFGIEEGSKFRNFNNTSSQPNVGIKVIKYFNFYEIKKTMSPDGINYFADFHDIFNTINVKDAVNNLGVKEVWFSLRPLSSEYPVVKDELLNAENFQAGGPESNMSSPTSGDISNSARVQNDLPIYNKTYVVYTYNLHRQHSENIHNRGHQIEAQLDYLDEGIFNRDERLFLNKFAGISFLSNSGKPIGRCGMTHFPPNTSIDYDWDNKTIVKSDICDWKPDGGTKEDINNSRWMNIKYSYPTVTNKFEENDPQYKWIIFWFQTIPGYNNGIKYGNRSISSWWDLIFYWDEAIKNKKKLYE